MSPEAQAFEPVALLFEQLKLPYCIVGSVAAYAHGHGRATVDVDVIVARIAIEHAAVLVVELATQYYVDEGAIIDAIGRGSSFNLIHHPTGLKVDVFVRNDSIYEGEVLRRREMSALFEDEKPQFWIESVEDLVLSKLRWFRSGGQVSEHQWNDVLGVLKVNLFDLDFDYLEQWSRKLKLEDLLQRAMDEAGFAGEGAIKENE